MPIRKKYICDGCGATDDVDHASPMPHGWAETIFAQMGAGGKDTQTGATCPECRKLLSKAFYRDASVASMVTQAVKNASS